MVRSLQDLTAASGQPNFPLTGGGYYNTSAFQTGPNLERFQAVVIDNRASGSASVAIGKLFVEQFTAANTGDAFYQPSAAAAAPIPMFSYGVLTGVPAPTLPYTTPSLVIGASTGQNEATITQKGTCLAYVLTTGTAAAVGTPLAADGAGNLTPTASVVPGVVLAISKGVLGTAQPATLTLVSVGGY